jgi:tRNA-specific 2-thiouridylase
MRGADPDKDQSYGLRAVPEEALLSTLFPLGGMHKAEVRKLAAAFRLPNARKRDSQGICFLGNVSVEDFLAQEFGSEPGAALDASGARIGTHAGALLSTLGQRVHLEGSPPGPWYVISKDIAANTLVVAHEHASDARMEFTLEHTNWLREPETGASYTAQYRYHGPKIEGSFDMRRSTFAPRAPVAEPVAAGQSLVLYAGEECIGGGIIA